MGGQGSGNFTPGRKVDPSEKSFNRSIRINPRKEAHRWLNERMDAFLDEQSHLPPGDQRGLADWLVDVLLVSEGHEPVQQTVIASSYDVAAIHDIVQYIMQRIDSGDFGVKSSKKTRQPKSEDIVLSEPMRNTIDRYIERGYTGGDDLDEDR